MDKEPSSVVQPETRSHIETHEQLVEEAKKFNLLSNVFMRVVFKDKLACQYVLRILTGIPDLKVKEVRIEYRVSKAASHDAVLDVLAEDGAGRLYNIEIQRADTVDHARRVRLYVSLVDSEYLEKGKDYAELPELFVIYISETDLWKAGHTTYWVRKYFENTDIPYDDGQHILYVNAAVDDGTETARLMQYFKTADPQDMSHGDLSKRVHLLKCEEGGYQEMCEVSEKIFKEGQKEGLAEGRAEGRAEGLAVGKMEHAKETALRLVDLGFATEQIAEIVQVSAALVTQWIDGRTVTAQR